MLHFPHASWKATRLKEKYGRLYACIVILSLQRTFCNALWEYSFRLESIMYCRSPFGTRDIFAECVMPYCLLMDYGIIIILNSASRVSLFDKGRNQTQMRHSQALYCIGFRQHRLPKMEWQVKKHNMKHQAAAPWNPLQESLLRWRPIVHGGSEWWYADDGVVISATGSARQDLLVCWRCHICVLFTGRTVQ